MTYLLWISFLYTNEPSTALAVYSTYKAQKISDERYPNRVVSFGLNRVYMKIRTPKSCCTDNT